MERYRKQQNKELNRLDKRTRKKLAQHQTKKRHKDMKYKLSLNYPDLYLQNSDNLNQQLFVSFIHFFYKYI